MGKKRSLRTTLTLVIAAAVMVTIVLISFFSNRLINRQFVTYITTQQGQKTKEIVAAIGTLYQGESAPTYSGRGRGHGMMGHRSQTNWKVDDINSIGMNALYDGYIIQVSDNNGSVVWDAQTTDSSMCSSVVHDISTRMDKRLPQAEGFTTKSYPLLKDQTQVGTVNVSHYGSYFLSEQDFQFLDALNGILLVVGSASFLASVLIGMLLAGRVSRPILNTSNAAREIAEGKLHTRITEQSSTKELAQLTSSINHLAETLERQEALRKELTGNVAHELRTPLTTMSTHIEAMVDGVWEATPQRLQSVYEELGRITLLVEDLESLAQVESKNLTLAKVPTNLQTLVESSLVLYQYELKEKHLTVHQDLQPIILLADPDRLHQVVGNLLSNAIKYTGDGGNIALRLVAQGGYALFSVADDGMGMSAEELPHVFERFYRTDKSRSRDTGGSGIGMTIVQSITEAHGGTVAVASTVDQGSIFTITLPIP